MRRARRTARAARRAGVLRVAGALAATLAAAALLAGCGVGVDAAPHVVNSKDVPFTLLSQAPPTTGVPSTGHFVTLFLAGASRLVATNRKLATPVSIGKVLRALGDGPTSAQAAAGLQSPLSIAAPLSVYRASGRRVTVDMSASFTRLTEQDQVVAMAQLVYTLALFPEIRSVFVRIDGRPARVPTDKGTLSAGPLHRRDYVALAPL